VNIGPVNIGRVNIGPAPQLTRGGYEYYFVTLGRLRMQQNSSSNKRIQAATRALAEVGGVNGWVDGRSSECYGADLLLLSVSDG
jgi:hypothetical protein